jgi:hypothetical protein
MSIDPVVEEIDRSRAEQRARFGYDFEAFYRDRPVLPPPAAQPVPLGRRVSGRR